MKKRLLSLFLAMTMVMSLFSGLTVTASAAESETITVTNEAELIHAIRFATGTVENPTEIIVMDDIVLELGTIVVPSDVFVKVKGYNSNITLTRKTAATFFSISGVSGGLAFESIVMDGTVDGTANKCTFFNAQGDTAAKSGPIVELQEGAKLLNGASNNSQNYAVTKMYAGSLIDNSVGSQGGALNLWNHGEFYMNGGTISNCRSTNNSGAVDANGSIIVINDGLIDGCRNSGNAYGGAIALRGGVNSVTINGGTIKNSKSYNYVAVYNVNDSTLIMNGGSIIENTERTNSYGLGAEGTFTEIHGGTIANNTSYSSVKRVSGNPILDNVLLSNSFTIKVTGELTEGASLQVNVNDVRTIAEGDGYVLKESDLKAFSSKNDDFVLYLDKDNNAIKSTTLQTVTFNANDSSTEPDTTTQKVPSDIATALTANTFTNGDKKFLGWATSNSVTTAEYADGAQIKATADTTLYAVWGDKEAWNPTLETKTVTYNGEAQSFGLDGYTVVEYKQGTDVVSPTDAGTYDVVITRGADFEHVGYSNTLYGGLVIKKAPLTITATAPTASIHIGNSIPTNFGYEVEGLVDGDSLTLTPTVSTTADSTVAGEFPVTASGAEAVNYAIKYVPATLTVTHHTPSSTGTTIDPKCTEQGYTEYTCSCGATYQDKFVPALGHNYTYEVTDVAEDSSTQFTITKTGSCQNNSAHKTTKTETHFYGTTGGKYEYTNGDKLYSCGYCNASFMVLAGGEVATITVDSEILDQPYTGSEIKPSVKVTQNGVEMDTSKYTIEYSNNTAIGTATVTVKMGDVIIGTATFQIVAPSGGSSSSNTSTSTSKNPDGSTVTPIPDPEVPKGEAGAAGEKHGFVDVADTDYYAKAVDWAAANGITGGVDATHFGPNMGCTRAHMVTFLWRAVGCPEPKGDASVFVDVVSNSYYEKAVAWGIENGIVKGTSATTFSPDDIVTRGQAVTFLARMAGMDSEVDGYNHSFTDVYANDYYNNAVSWAATEGITSGTSESTFSPGDNCLRWQIVTFLYRYFVK